MRTGHTTDAGQLTEAPILGWPAPCCGRRSPTLATAASDTRAIAVAVVTDLPAVVVLDWWLFEVREVAALDGARRLALRGAQFHQAA
jgi:hypothetical protein